MTVALSLLSTATAAPTANNPIPPLPVVEDVEHDNDNIARATAPPGCSQSHLPALDSLTGLGPTYNGWQDDVRKAEEMVHNDFDDYLITMRKKQSMHKGSRSHPQL